jgi:hypothetical protein
MHIEVTFDPVYMTIEVSDGLYKNKIQISRDDFLKWLFGASNVKIDSTQRSSIEPLKSP